MEGTVRADFNHLSQTELMRFLDNEMSPEDRADASFHTERCVACGRALQETAELLEDLKAERVSAEGSTVDASAARALLKERLTREESPASRRFRNPFGKSWNESWLSSSLYGVVAALSVAVLFWSVPRWNRPVVEMAGSLPNRALTPGVTRPVDVDVMCSAENDDLDPEVPPSIQSVVFREYGISLDRSQKDFQVDYLISPQLGGTDDVRNLWPQSYKDTKWNARAKDDLERYLSRMVCEKKISLREAQRAIATNWIAAYQKYFRTNEPS